MIRGLRYSLRCRSYGRSFLRHRELVTVPRTEMSEVMAKGTPRYRLLMLAMVSDTGPAFSVLPGDPNPSHNTQPYRLRQKTRSATRVRCNKFRKFSWSLVFRSHFSLPLYSPFSGAGILPRLSPSFTARLPDQASSLVSPLTSHLSPSTLPPPSVRLRFSNPSDRGSRGFRRARWLRWPDEP